MLAAAGADEAERFFDEELARWRRVIDSSGIKLEPKCDGSPENSMLMANSIVGAFWSFARPLERQNDHRIWL